MATSFDAVRRAKSMSGTGPLLHVGIIGQSNANNGSGDPAVSTSRHPLASAWMFNGGVRPGGAAAQLAQLVPLVEDNAFFSTSDSGGESVAWGFAHRMQTLRPGTRLLFSTSAIGGTSYAAMAQGTATYTQMLAQVAAGKALAARMGVPYRFLCSLVLHGEFDQAAGNTAYAANLATWQANYQTDIQAITGQREAIPLFIDQQSDLSPNVSGAAASTAYAVYVAGKTSPSLTVNVGPRSMYSGQQTDGSTLHMSSPAQRWHGQRFAGACWARQFADIDWRPVSPIAGQVNFSSGVGGAATNTLVADFYSPMGTPLAFDFAQVVRNSIRYGFSYFDDTSPPTITAVALSGNQQVTFTLSGVPTGTAGSRVLRGAWGTGTGTQGPIRGNIKINLRDSVTDRGHLGQPLENWCSIFQEAVT